MASLDDNPRDLLSDNAEKDDEMQRKTRRESAENAESGPPSKKTKKSKEPYDAVKCKHQFWEGGPRKAHDVKLSSHLPLEEHKAQGRATCPKYVVEF